MTPDVHTAVGELLRVQCIRIQVTPTLSYRAYAPCRLAQLADAVAASSGGSGGRSKAGSRMLIAADQMELYRTIAMATNLWAYALQIDRRPFLAGAPTGAGVSRARFETPPLGRLLRKVAGEAMRLRRFAMADRVAGDARNWAQRIDTMLPQPSIRADGSMVGRPGASDIRGRACPNCEVTDMPDVRDDGTYRVPVLQLSYAEVDGAAGGTASVELPYWWCKSCGMWGWLEIPDEHREASVMRSRVEYAQPVTTAPVQAPIDPAAVAVRDMWFPVRCNHCRGIYDLGKVTVTARYADCSMWKSPCCGLTVDDRGEGWKLRADYVKLDRNGREAS